MRPRARRRPWGAQGSAAIVASALALAGGRALPVGAVEIDDLFSDVPGAPISASAEALVRDAFANLFELDAVVLVQSTTRRASGELERTRFRLYRSQVASGERRVLIALEDSSEGGALRVLEIERPGELRSWIYVPQVDSDPIESGFRITDPFLGSLSDSDPSAVRADLRQLVRAHEIVSREPALRANEPVQRIGLRPLAARQSERVELDISGDPPVILEYRYFEGGDPEPARTARVPRGDLRRFRGRWLPGRMLYRDRVQGTETELILRYEPLPSDAPLRRRLFDPSSFHRAPIPAPAG